LGRKVAFHAHKFGGRTSRRGEEKKKRIVIALLKYQGKRRGRNENCSYMSFPCNQQAERKRRKERKREFGGNSTNFRKKKESIKNNN